MSLLVYKLLLCLAVQSPGEIAPVVLPLRLLVFALPDSVSLFPACGEPWQRLF